MRNDLLLIQSAIANYDFNNIIRDHNNDFELFRFYLVDLSDIYKGIPSQWYFAILSEQENNVAKFTKNEIYDQARTMVRDAISHTRLPLVILCDVPNVYFNSELGFQKDAVFYLDKNNLPGKNFTARDVRETPILVAVRNKFNKSEVPFYFNPYKPMEPAVDWRFFGRKKEINDISNSTANYFIVGARKIGKTSLLDAVKRNLERNGQKVYSIQVQNLSSIEAVIETIASELSLEQVHKARRASKILGVDYLTSIIKKLKLDKKRIVLILDEIGNALTRDQRDDWNFMGTLRDLSHKSEIRVIASGFQEIIMKQYNEPDGPFVNFGHTMMLEGFNKNELDEFLINPLNLWSEVTDKKKLNNIIREKFGSHPLVLQYVGKFLFERVFQQQKKKVDDIVRELLNRENILLFEPAVKEIFVREVSYLERFVFLKLCSKALKNEKNLGSLQINNRDLIDIMKCADIDIDLDGRNWILEKLSMRGLLHHDAEIRINFRIAAPIIFTYYASIDSVDTLLEDYLVEIKKNPKY